MLTALSIGRGGLGRFGNCCWTIAGVIGIANKSGQPYGFPPWRVVDALNFGSTEDIDVYKYLKNPLPDIPEGVHFRDYGYFWGYRDINLPSGNWSIDAHLQSDKFFSHCLPLIKETFRFKDEPEQNDLVAIHVRAGDYTDGNSGHHPRCDWLYYKKAMNEFPEGIKFICFTDDTAYALSVIDGRCLTFRSGNYIEDFKAMKKCKSFITSNSSFSSFASILGDHPEKKVIQPSQWFGESMPDVWRLNTKDLYHEGAIII